MVLKKYLKLRRLIKRVKGQAYKKALKQERKYWEKEFSELKTLYTKKIDKLKRNYKLREDALRDREHSAERLNVHWNSKVEEVRRLEQMAYEQLSAFDSVLKELMLKAGRMQGIKDSMGYLSSELAKSRRKAIRNQPNIVQ